MSEKTPWSPTLENAKEFSELANEAHGNSPPVHPLRVPPLAGEDTSPLQGSKDISDADSLEDVIAESYEPRSATSPPTDTGKS